MLIEGAKDEIYKNIKSEFKEWISQVRYCKEEKENNRTIIGIGVLIELSCYDWKIKINDLVAKYKEQGD